MKKSEARDRIQKLYRAIELHAKEYYELDAPSVSDAVYDALVQELKGLEERYPEYKDPNAVIYRVGGQALENFVKVAHDRRMLSLQDCFSYEELYAWEKRIQKFVPSPSWKYFCELKLDGLAVSLIYEDGHLIRAVTRGDGSVGEDITQNVKTISSIPLFIKGSFGTLEVRGEIVMSKATLSRLNTHYEKQGKQLLANTRNAAAGSVRQLDPNLARARGLEFFAWDIAFSSATSFITHSEKHEFLRQWGFPTAPYEAVVPSLRDAEKIIEHIQAQRQRYGYGTDGVVIQVDELGVQDVLGVVGKAPRFAIAYKYPAEQATSVVHTISVQVGRTGVLTPLAQFVPTLVAGSMVSKATLHNIEQIQRLDIRVGDTVVIQKAGDVIPEVVEVLLPLRPKKTTRFVMPESCPECGGGVLQKKGSTGEVSVAYYCANPQCPAKQTKSTIHFVHTMEIYEVGPRIIERLQEEGLITDASDLFVLTEADLAGLERFGAKSAANIIREIEAKKTPTLDRFISALGIPHVGETTARDLALHFKTFEAFAQTSQVELESIENIGPTVCESILTYFNNKASQHFLEKLFSRGVRPVPLQVKKQGTFEGKTVVLTGTLTTLSRDQAKKMIQNEGGTVAGSVSSKTDYVLVGDNPGSKEADAKKLGIRILSEQEFLKIIQSLV